MWGSAPRTVDRRPSGWFAALDPRAQGGYSPWFQVPRCRRSPPRCRANPPPPSRQQRAKPSRRRPRRRPPCSRLTNLRTSGTRRQHQAGVPPVEWTAGVWFSGRDRGCGRAGPVVVDRGLVVQRRVATLTVVEHLDPFEHGVRELGPAVPGPAAVETTSSTGSPGRPARTSPSPSSAGSRRPTTGAAASAASAA